MGLLNDIIKGVTREAKYALEDEIRSEVRQGTRQAVRGTIDGTKEGIGKAGQAVKDGITGKNQENPQVMQAAPVEPVAQQPVAMPAAEVQAAPAESAAAPDAPSENVGDALANMTEQSAPMMQMANQIMNDDGPLGKIANAMATANMTEEQKAEMKQSLEMASDPQKMAEAQQALRDNSDKVEEALKQSGVNPEELKNTIDQNQINQNM